MATHTLTVPDGPAHTHTFFSFTSKCVIIYTPNTHSHAYKYGCNIQSVIWSHHTHTHSLTGWLGVWYMVLMFWKCESDVLHGVSLQLSTLVGPCGSHHTLRCCSIQTSEGTDECLHLSLCLSAAQPGLSSSAQDPLFFFLSGSFCLYTVSIFFSFLFFFYRKSKNASGLKSKWKTGKFNHGYQYV